MSPISPSTMIDGLIALSASTAFFVSETFSAKGSVERSKTTESKPAFAASTALASECVWSALRKIGKSNSSRMLRTSAAAWRTPTNSLSPSETPTITGTLSPRAAFSNAFNATRSEMLKWPTAVLLFSDSDNTLRNVFISPLFFLKTQQFQGFRPNVSSRSLLRGRRRRHHGLLFADPAVGDQGCDQSGGQNQGPCHRMHDRQRHHH